MTDSNCLGGIAYINLDYRTDRKTHIEQELHKLLPLTSNIHRISAVLEPMCGHLGCGKSHVKALEVAIERGWDSVLIVEDDMGFTEPTDILVDRIRTAATISWDVLMLGCGHKSTCASEHGFLEKVQSATCTHAYIVRKHYYATLLDNFKTAVTTMTKESEDNIAKCKAEGIAPTKLNYCSAVDQSWFQLQERDTFYLCNPQLSVQLGELYSDNNCSFEHQAHMLNSGR